MDEDICYSLDGRGEYINNVYVVQIDDFFYYC